MDVLLITFNRPEYTARQLNMLQGFGISNIYIFADGPKVGSNDDRISMNQTIVDSYSHNKLIMKENLGCRRGVQTALDWFFSNVEAGIIIEDDILISQDFLRYCKHCLLKFDEDKQIRHIGGCNPIENVDAGIISSKYSRIWGWATWKDRWKEYRNFMANDGFTRLKSCLKTAPDQQYRRIFTKKLNRVEAKKIDTWDYQYCVYNYLHGTSLIPGKNLVSNEGFNSQATHTKDPNSWLAKLEVSSNPTELTMAHAEFNQEYDTSWMKKIIQNETKRFKWLT